MNNGKNHRLQGVETTRLSLMEKLAQDPNNPLVWHRLNLLYGPPITRWCQTVGMNKEDALDVSQNVLLELWKSADKFKYQAGKSFRSYLARLVFWCSNRYRLNNYKRKLSNEKADEHPWIKKPDLTLLEKEIDDVYDLELLEIASRLVRNQVETRHWEAFRLQAIQGISSRKTAEILNINPSTALWSRWYVQKRIRAMAESMTQSRDLNVDQSEQPVPMPG